jgi:hypothetical protein
MSLKMQTFFVTKGWNSLENVSVNDFGKILFTKNNVCDATANI